MPDTPPRKIEVSLESSGQETFPDPAPAQQPSPSDAVAPDVDISRIEVEDFAQRIAHPAIFDTVREPLLVLDDRFRVIRASASFYRTFDERAESVLGRSLFSLGNNTWNIASLHDALENVLPDGRAFNDYQVDNVFPSIGRRIFHLNAREIVPEKASPRFILLAFQDITQKVWADRHAKERAKDLERSNADLEQFASIAAHDLQSPLNKIATFADILASSAKDRHTEQEKGYVSALQGQCERMRMLMQDLLVFSEIASNDQTVEEINLVALVNEVLGQLQTEIAHSAAKVNIADLPTVKGRKFRLMQLFQNLIQNSLKYRMKDVPPEIEIGAKMQGSMVEIAIKDNGIGFQQEHAAKIFEPFRRLHGSRSEYKGTGMGLAICDRVVKDHGGTISARGVPNEGATFVVTLPVQR